MKIKSFIFLTTIISFNIVVLLYGIDSISISYKEIIQLENNSSLITKMSNYFLTHFEHNDFYLRLPMVILHSICIVLFYLITKYQNNIYDRIFSLLAFIFTPGVYASGLLMNESVLIILATLLFVLAYQRVRILSYIILPLLILLDNSFIILYFSLGVYSLIKRKKYFLIINIILFVLAFYFGYLEIGGKPKGYFLDIIGWYAILCSPLVFIAYFYALYRKLINGCDNIIVYIGFFSLIFALILSFRQNINIIDFVPFIILSIPIYVSVFASSVRIRLPKYRKKYIILISILATSIIANYIIVIKNKYLYRYLETKNKHFAYKYHIAKELAFKLKENKISNITFDDKKLLKRLSFYGIINNNSKYRLVQKKPSDIYKTITINYFDIEIDRFYVTKNNN
jgi:hypothetical protein